LVIDSGSNTMGEADIRIRNRWVRPQVGESVFAVVQSMIVFLTLANGLSCA